MAVLFEYVHILALDHDSHALLRLADRQFGRVQAAVLGRHSVEVYVEARGQLAYRDAHAARSEVVRLLDEARDLGAAEQTFELAFLGSVALLNFRAALLDRFHVVLFRRAGGSADAVATRTAAQEQYGVARCGRFAAYVLRFHCSHDRAYLQSFGHIIGVVDLTHMGGRQTYLVAVTRITRGRLGAYYTLRQLALHGLGHALVYVARARYAHGLIYVAAARQRVANGPAQTGRRTAERLDFGRMVMRFVLELKQPLFGAAVDVHVDEYAACVVLLALLQIVEHARLLEVTRAHGRQLHEA